MCHAQVNQAAVVLMNDKPGDSLSLGNSSQILDQMEIFKRFSFKVPVQLVSFMVLS